MLTTAELARTPVVDDASAVTVLAIALDDAMACDGSARARYLAIYGVEWSPLSTARQDGIAIAFALGTRTSVL